MNKKWFNLVHGVFASNQYTQTSQSSKVKRLMDRRDK